MVHHVVGLSTVNIYCGGKNVVFVLPMILHQLEKSFCTRLTYSIDMVVGEIKMPPHKAIDHVANRDQLRNLTALEVFDKVKLFVNENTRASKNGNLRTSWK